MTWSSDLPESETAPSIKLRLFSSGEFGAVDAGLGEVMREADSSIASHPHCSVGVPKPGEILLVPRARWALLGKIEFVKTPRDKIKGACDC